MHIDNEADAATVVFKTGIVKPLLFRYTRKHIVPPALIARFWEHNFKPLRLNKSARK